MGSTNKTDILELNQFIDSDKPTWRGDVNSDNEKIDHFAEETYDALIVNATETASARAIALEAGDKSDVALAAANNALPRDEFTVGTVMERVKAGDGEGSGLDADFVRGRNPNEFATIDYVNSKMSNGFPFSSTTMVVIGASNSGYGSFTTKLANHYGMQEYNYSVGGTGMATSPTFLDQARQAAEAGDFQNHNVGVVIIGSSGNDIRNDIGDAYGPAFTLLSYLRSTFPNARVVFIPAFWSADTHVAPIPLNYYDPEWTMRVPGVASDIRRACLDTDSEYVAESWTWLTGLQGVMKPQEVHPNDKGMDIIARWMRAYFRGESTRFDVGWRQAQRGSMSSGSRGVFCARDGWRVKVQGSFNTSTAAANGFLDVATLPMGFTPAYDAIIAGRRDPYSLVEATVYRSGLIRLWSGNMDANTAIELTGTFDIA